MQDRESCPVRSCAQEKSYEGCHQCDSWPCSLIDNFPIPVGKKVIMRAIPAWKELGTEKWVEQEIARYHCPHCGFELFRAPSDVVPAKSRWIRIECALSYGGSEFTQGDFSDLWIRTDPIPVQGRQQKFAQ